MTELKRVLIMAGGTGGHVFPGLTVAKLFREHQIEVAWLGTANGLEAKLVPQAGLPIHFISIQGLRGKGLKGWCLAPWRLTVALVQAARIIRQVRPDIVIGMGGFVSGPGGIASFLLRKKLIIHEQNAKAGLTNQWLTTFAARVLEAFPNTFPKTKKAITIGNPVRKEIASFAAPEQRLAARQRPHLLVIGGSLGAQAINALLPEVLAHIPASTRPEVWHQTGQKYFQPTVEAYQKAGISAQLVPFIDEMDKAYLWADMVLCRAGALTIAELCAAGLGAILIPYPYAVDDHQTANAHFMTNQQAALLLPQAQLTTSALVELLKDYCASAEKRLKMAKAAYQLRQVDAAEKILTLCKEVCH